MSDRAAHAEAAPQATTGTDRQPAPTSEAVSSTHDVALLAPRRFADGQEGPPPLRRLAMGQQRRALLALQSTIGNSAFQRLLTPDPRLLVRLADASPPRVARIALD